MRVLVSGSRFYDIYNEEDRFKVYKVLDQFCIDRNLKGPEDEYGNWLPDGLTIIHGGAKGVDTIADGWAIINWVPFEIYPADWDKHGKAAGPIRNKEMLDTGIDVVIAFPRGVSKGTRHMMKIAREAGVEVIEIG